MPKPPILKVGYVTAWTGLVITLHMAAGQLMPVKPPVPALRTIESSFGTSCDVSNRWARVLTEPREVRSRSSGWRKMRWRNWGVK